MVKTVIVVIAILLLWWFFIHRRGNPRFWKGVADHPDAAYDWFMSHDHWVVILAGSNSPTPDRELYAGPFPVWIPKLGGKRVTVYGRREHLEQAEQQFLESLTSSVNEPRATPSPDVTIDSRASDSSIPSQASWVSLATAIVGSGTYSLEGTPELQVKRLTDWLRQGEQWGYDWRPVYADLYNGWHEQRAHLPPVHEMEKRIAEKKESHPR